ncbi:MAG TPA: NPCBM/NEW2 domain-containing protein, partial [Jatrophihabitantaceae bacterium]|nr:NPCBM/NEW2 domain-containing protein [Jatrophihabitantaceae bacterium]
LWAEMSAPLLIGSDLRKATPETLAILSNKDVIAVDQDKLGVQGQVIAQGNGIKVFNKPLANGDRAVALYNSNDASAKVSTTAAQVGLRSSAAYSLKDLWSGATTETAGTISANVPAHGTVLYRVKSARDWTNLAPSTTQGVTSPSGYVGADIALAAGASTTLTSTLNNYGRATLTDVRITGTVPDGWTVTPTSATTKNRVDTNGSFATTWTLKSSSSAQPGSYPLTITATYRYGGRKVATNNTRVAVQVVPTPPTGTVALSDLTWVSTSNGWGPVEKDMSNGETAQGDGHPLTIRGNVYPKGIGAHAPSDVVYYIGGKCSSLTTDVGVDDETGGNGQVIFQVFAGDTKVAQSDALTGTSPAQTLHADLTGANWLRLHVDPDGSNTWDHSDWAGPQLTCTA